MGVNEIRSSPCVFDVLTDISNRVGQYTKFEDRILVGWIFNSSDGEIVPILFYYTHLAEISRAYVKHFDITKKLRSSDMFFLQKRRVVCLVQMETTW